MGLLEGSGRGGKGADGTQREVHQRHVACQKAERGRRREEVGRRWRWLRGGRGEGREAAKEGGEVRVRYLRERWERRHARQGSGGGG